MQSPLPPLTKQERAVVRLTWQGLTYKQVARQLNMTYGTVHGYMARIHRKWKVRTVAQVLKIALEKHSIRLPKTRGQCSEASIALSSRMRAPRRARTRILPLGQEISGRRVGRVGVDVERLYVEMQSPF